MSGATAATLKALAAACPAARPAEPSDVVAGVMPRYAVSPADVAEASAVLRAAAAHDLAVIARGTGSRLDWGTRPQRCDLVVDTLRLDRVIEHATGDLVTRVQAGVGMGQLGELLAGAGQQLALDQAPASDGHQAASGGTVGGTLATGVAGPRRLRYGTPRDLVIGITVVRADGTVASSGGKVVKNVAGYDLGKLYAGSFGTLGLIVEAAFRLHPLPAAAAYTTVERPDAAAAARVIAAATGSEIAPTAVEISRAGRGQPIRVGVLVDGDPAGVDQRSALLRDILGGTAATSPDAPQWWGRYGAPDDPGAPAGQENGPGGAGGPAGGGGIGGAGGHRPGGSGTLIRLAFWAEALPRILAAVDAAAAGTGLDPLMSGSAAAGVLHAAIGPAADPAAITAFVAALRTALARGDGDAGLAGAAGADRPPVLASAVVVHAPPPVRDQVDLWGSVPGLPLMRAVKDQFDPGHRMAPGRFVGGI